MEADQRLQTSTRDTAALEGTLVSWLQAQLDADQQPELTLHGGPDTAGFSSETVLFDLAWRRDSERRRGSYVLRLPPPPDAFPVFPSYDMARQVQVMRLVGERSGVPVPTVHWFEPDPTVLGAPFFVMERIDGVVPSDIPMYVMEGWLSEASADQQARVESAMVDVLAGIHGVEASPDELAFLELSTEGDTPLQRHFAHERAYHDWVRGVHRFPVVEALFDWLAERWPDDEGPAVASWGDARLGNVLFHDFEPVAVLDWEMAAVGPRELDVAWLLFFHRYFQRFAEMLDHPGMPDFLDRERIVAAYEARTGRTLRNLDWYLAYAALRMALIMIRISTRAIHFGERPMPDDPQDLILGRDHLEEIVSST